MLIHTDQKPYQCDQCDQTFRQKQLLKRHQNLYHNPNYIPPMPKEKTHECPECGRSFRHKGNLIRHMALHDPDSTAQEKAIALKIGRRKKIQIIDGQQVEVMTEGEEDDEDLSDLESDEDSDMMAVQGQDGQHYVVLEVIQLEGEGEGQAVVSINQEAAGTSSAAVEGQIVSVEEAGGESVLPGTSGSQEDDGTGVDPDTIVKKQDISNCFGFDDEEEDDE